MLAQLRMRVLRQGMRMRWEADELNAQCSHLIAKSKRGKRRSGWPTLKTF